MSVNDIQFVWSNMREEGKVGKTGEVDRKGIRLERESRERKSKRKREGLKVRREFIF